MTADLTLPPSDPILVPPSRSLEACFAAEHAAPRWDGDPPHYSPAATPRPSDVAEALGLLVTYERAAISAHRERVRAWIVMLGTRVATMPPSAEIEFKTDGLLHCTGDLPARVFGDATLLAATRAFNFMPSVSAMDGLLREAAQPFLRRLAGIRKVATAMSEKPAPASAAATRAASEVAAVTAAATACRQELAAGEVRLAEAGAPERPTTTAQPAYLSDAVLAVRYRQIVAKGGWGASTAAMRLAALTRPAPDSR